MGLLEYWPLPSMRDIGNDGRLNTFVISKQLYKCQKASAHRVHILVEMKQGRCICPLSWSVQYTATLLVMVNVVKGGGRGREGGRRCVL
jgi:hypothetical protein